MQIVMYMSTSGPVEIDQGEGQGIDIPSTSKTSKVVTTCCCYYYSYVHSLLGGSKEPTMEVSEGKGTAQR